MTNKIVVFSTAASAEEAEKIARGLVEARLAACVNVVPSVRSFYRWQGKFQVRGANQLIFARTPQLFRKVP